MAGILLADICVDYLGHIVLFFSDVSLQEIYESKIDLLAFFVFPKYVIFYMYDMDKKYENARENNQLSL
ncbi:MAG: hypothetical protein ACLTCI_06105 [[Clostridium] nexile]